MSNRVANHLHRYKKVNLAGWGHAPFYVYKCVKPTCSHYIRMDLAEGRLCECNRCGGPMLITKTVLVHSGGKPMTKPHCLDCIKRRKAKDVKAITEFLEGTITKAGGHESPKTDGGQESK